VIEVGREKKFGEGGNITDRKKDTLVGILTGRGWFCYLQKLKTRPRARLEGETANEKAKSDEARGERKKKKENYVHIKKQRGRTWAKLTLTRQRAGDRRTHTGGGKCNGEEKKSFRLGSAD